MVMKFFILPQFSWGSMLLSLVLAFLVYAIYHLYLKPSRSINYYKKQGGVGLFHWGLVSYLANYKNALSKGDFFGIYKEALKKNPEAKFIVENFASRVHVMLIQPEMIKEALRRYDIYQKDVKLFKPLAEFAQGTMVFAEGKEWKEKRKMVSSSFNFESLKHMVPMIISTTQDKFNDWIAKGQLKDMNLVEHMAMITGEVTGKFFFGKDFGNQKVEGLPITTAVQQYLMGTMRELLTVPVLVFGTSLMKTNILPRYRQLNKTSEELRRVFREMIREAEMNGTKEKNLLSLYLDGTQKGEAQNMKMNHDEIVGEFIGIFAAGTDTTSHLLGSVIYFLWKYPEVFAKVKEEVEREFADPSTVDIEKVNKMDYMTAVLKETLRLGGPSAVLFDREAEKDDELCGVKIRKGDVVNILQNLLFFDERFYSRPDEFIPERWLNIKEYSQEGYKNEPYAYIPFSAGPRNCVGQHLAMIEAKIVLSLFIKTFTFTFPEDFNFVLVLRFVYETADPLLVTLKAN